jgi:hypothetical protein
MNIGYSKFFFYSKMFRVSVTCIRGCRFDTHCEVDEMCHKQLCLPRVCSSQSLGPNVVHMMNKAANTGLKSMVRCAIGYTYAVS